MTDPSNVDDPVHEFGRSMSVEVVPGVRAWLEPTSGGGVEVMYVEAVTEGSGQVGAWLDGLPTDRRVVVPNVTSSRLAGMLERRGFLLRKGLRPLALLGLTWCDVWVRRPVPRHLPH